MSEPDHPASGASQRLRASAASLTARALRRLSTELPWYRELDVEQRAAIDVLAHTGVASFLDSLDSPGAPGARELLATAPQELSRAVSLQQTLDLIATLVGIVEEEVPRHVDAEDASALTIAALRFSSDVAFSAARIYAHAAEVRGAWDARLEATVVDALLSGSPDESVLSRTSALGWSGAPHVVGIVAGAAPGGSPLLTPPADVTNVVALPGTHHARAAQPPAYGPEMADRLRRIARRTDTELLLGVQGERLVLIVGGGTPDQVHHAAEQLVEATGREHVATGPMVSDVTEVGHSLRPALAALQSVPAWPHAPQPLHADDVLPERALAGDEVARQMLVDRIYLPLRDSPNPLLPTLDAYWSAGQAIEATARRLFVHTNTVRYRLHRVEDLIGWDPTDPREGFVVRIGVAVGRLGAAARDGGRTPGPA